MFVRNWECFWINVLLIIWYKEIVDCGLYFINRYLIGLIEWFYKIYINYGKNLYIKFNEIIDNYINL